MPIEFSRETCTVYGHYTVCDSTKLVMAYDGSGRRISKTRMHNSGNGIWDTTQVTHYTGIGTEIRERVNMPVFFRVTLTRLKPRSYIEKDILRLSNGGAILPKRSFGASRQGLGRYGIENADGMAKGDEFYLKNHLGSTMMVAQVSSTNASEPAKVAAAYDYRAFGEQVTLTKSADKVTENFTGKEHDDEIELDYFGARYLDPMLGMWTSVDPKRQFASPYLYAGNGVNPVNAIDPDGNVISILLSNELVGKNSYVNKYTADEVASGQSRGPQVVPLYKMYVRNSSGSSSVFPVTRDAVAGKGPFNTNGSYGGNIRTDGKMGFRIELTDLETGDPTIVDQNGIKRSNVQIHIGPGCSKGCSLLQGGRNGRENFESTIKAMIQEDIDNNKGDDIYVDTEEFVPFDAQ